MYKEAKLKLKAYLNAWKKLDLKEMRKHTTKTYRANHIDTSHLEAFMGAKKLTKFKILEPKRIGDAMTEIPVEIYYHIGKDIFHKLIKVRLGSEKEAHQPYTGYPWGVNPISGFREGEIPEKKEEKQK